ncbi:MAG: phosphopentomutase [Acidobacteria bacterium]|nr:phosphopentomutase [Acidobacteriota bacterium]
MSRGSALQRFVLVVLDGLGIGEMPDAATFGDEGSDTLGHILEHRDVKIPNLQALGLLNIRPFAQPAAVSPLGIYGKAAIASAGKDTATGHWEMAGILTENPFPTYPRGFPSSIIRAFQAAIGRGILGNYAASGTEIIKELGQEHLRTGKPIVYTSADSVFQIAAHEQVVPVEELYEMCVKARAILMGKDRVARVIARPFVGQPGSFTRTHRRRDFAVAPPAATLLDLLKDWGYPVAGVGKIWDIFSGKGITREIHTRNDEDGMDKTMDLLREEFPGLIFTNLVDFDTLYGHRNDVEGYASALEAFDARLPELLALLRANECVIFTADHGNDPVTPSTDHSREYVPVVAYGPSLRRNVDLGVRRSLADIGQTIAENFGLQLPLGTSFLSQIV